MASSSTPTKQPETIRPPDTLGTGYFLPKEPLRSEYIDPPETLTANQKKTLFTFKGHQRVVLFSIADNGAGKVKYNVILDHKVKPLPSVYIWQIVEFLGGAISSNGILSPLPTGFTASSQFTGHVTHMTAMFTSDSSGNVADESLTILYDRFQMIGEIEVTAENVGTSDIEIGGVLVTESVYQ